MPGAGDLLPPQRREVTILAGRREGFGLGAPGWNLSLQLSDLEPDRRGEKFITRAAVKNYFHYQFIDYVFVY